MVERPAAGTRNGLARLRPQDRRQALSVLCAAPEKNAYLLAQIARGALSRDDLAGPLMGHWREGVLDGVAIFGSNLVLSSPCSATAIASFARYARTKGFRVWVVVGEDATIDTFMNAYGRQTRATLLERSGQHLYALSSPPDFDEAARRIRPADIRETERLMSLDREMVVEELGFDAFARDLESYRRGWKRRIREGRSWVLEREGDLVFKVDHSASAEQVVQLAGVYTRPASRRQGIAGAAMANMCRWLLERVPVVTLYVAADNHPAIALYEGLGFEHRGLVRSVWFAD